jgi:hypothetical protein
LQLQCHAAGGVPEVTGVQLHPAGCGNRITRLAGMSGLCGKLVMQLITDDAQP